MKTFSSKLLYYSMYQYITKVLPTIFGNYTRISGLEIKKASLISNALTFSFQFSTFNSIYIASSERRLISSEIAMNSSTFISLIKIKPCVDLINGRGFS